MPMLFASWLLATSVMPLLLGAAIGAISPWILRPCASPRSRQALRAALAAWALHLALVGSGLLIEGDMSDYGAVLLAALLASAWGCRAGVRR